MSKGGHIKTIFKSNTLMALEEEAQERRHILEGLIEEGRHGIDENTKGADIVREGCPHCRRTLDELVRDEMDLREERDFYDGKANLDKELWARIYCFVDAGTWRGRRNGHKRLESTNLNSVLTFHSCEYGHIWYDEKDGNIHSECIHHDGRNYYLYREFETIHLEEGDPRREKWKDYASPSGHIGQDSFEYMLYDAKTEGEWERLIEELTLPIGHYVADIYGWKKPEGE